MDPYSRLFTSRLGFFYTADKATGGAGAEGTTLKAELGTAKTRVAELEADKAKADEALKVETDRAEKAEADLKAATEKTAKLEADLKSAQEKEAAAQKLAAETGEAATKAKAAQDKAEADLKTSDERAEARLREIDAKNGGTLPVKAPGAGDHTQEPGIDASASPRDRLKATIKVVGE